MGKTVSEKTPFQTKIPEGTHQAICVGVFDLGTVHNKTFNKDANQVLLLWELYELENEEGFPLTIHKMYTASLSKKSNLRADLTSWRGRAFTPAELEGFDLSAVLGKPCQLLILHNAVDGSVYANIQSVSSVPRGLVVPKPKNTPVSFTFGEDTAVPHGTPEWVEAKIKSAPEWAELVEGKGRPAAPALTEAEAAGVDDVPF